MSDRVQTFRREDLMTPEQKITYFSAQRDKYIAKIAGDVFTNATIDKAQVKKDMKFLLSVTDPLMPSKQTPQKFLENLCIWFDGEKLDELDKICKEFCDDTRNFSSVGFSSVGVGSQFTETLEALHRRISALESLHH